MKTFRDYLSEEVLPTALVADGSFDLEKDAVRAQINTILAGIASHSCVTPYHVLQRISKALAYFHIILPKKTYMEGERGIEVFELQQFGHKMGMTDQGEFVSGVPPKFYLYMVYSQVMGRFVVSAKIVGEDELDHIVSLQEDAAARQMVAKAGAPKEGMHTALGDCDCSQGDSPSTKSAVSTMMRKTDKKLAADSLEEAMTRKQKDMAVRRFMSHDPKAGESILAMGKKEREEKKSFASAKKEIKRLKEEEQIDELSKDTLRSYVSKRGTQLSSMMYGPDRSGKSLTGRQQKNAVIGIKRAMKEDTLDEEQIDELKKSTYASYIKKSAKSQSDLSFDHGEDEHRQYGDRGEDPDRDKEVDDRERKISNREKGINRAVNKLSMKESRMPASVIASKQKYANMSDKEFAEKHGHKSEKQLRDMAARHGYGFDKATKTGSDHYVKRVSSAKQIDELYGKGSLEKIRSHHQGEANKLAQGGSKQEKRMGALGRLHRDSEERESAIKYHHGKAKKARGLMSKLTMREDTLDEKHLTPAETRKKEEIVKSMKKGLEGFKERYGKRAKAVMYATATKQAEKIAEDTDLDEAMGSVKKNYGLRKMKTKVKTIVRRGLGKERETQTVLVTRKGDPHAATGGGVRRIPKDKYDPKIHNMASE